MRPAAGVLVSSALFVLLGGLEWEGSRARWLRELATGDEDQRIAALEGLGEIGGADVDEAIAGALADGSEAVRLEAAAACERRALARCAAPLAEWLDDTDPGVRATAARALGRTGQSSDAPALARALGDARPAVRRAAVDGLSALGGGASVSALVTALADADPIVREHAATALGRIATHERGTAATALLTLTRDDAPEVRAAAIDALGALGDARAAAAGLVALDDEASEVQLAALRTLTRVPSAAATAALVRAVEDDERVGRAALAALARAPGPSALSAIVAALGRPSIARSAEDALITRMRASEAARAEGIEALAAAMARAASEPRARLAGTASRLATEVSIAGLEHALLASWRDEPTPAVLEALGRTGAEEALVPVLDGLASESASLRTAALSGLEGYAAVHEPDGRVLDPVSLALPRLPPEARARAVTIVARARAERVSAWLIERLGDEAREVRIAALRALRGRVSEPAIEPLLVLLESTDAEVRGRAALALASRTEGLGEEPLSRLAGWLVADDARDRGALLTVLGAALRRAGDTPAASVVRTAITDALASEDAELADAAAQAIAASHDARLARAALDAATAAGPRERARTLRALAGADLDEARAFATAALDDPDAIVGATAALTLGEIGGREQARAILAHARQARFPRSASLAFAIARLARRGMVARAEAAPVLAVLAAAHDPYVRADAAVAAAALGGGIEGVEVATWLAPSMPPVVRIAAARWALATLASGEASSADELRAALATCASDLVEPAVARACSDTSGPRASEDADVIALDAGGHPMRERWIALRLADGSVRVGTTDARGRVRLEDAPAGALGMEAPESTALIP